MKIELRKWRFEDKDALIMMCNTIDRTYLSGRMPDPYTEEAAAWWLNMAEESEGKNGVFREILVDGKIVGNITVEQKDDVFCKDAEIGYYLLPEAKSKGIMTEAARQICEIAFETLDIIRITGLVYESNTASRRVLEKNGFELEGIKRNAIYKNSRFYSDCIYGKLK